MLRLKLSLGIMFIACATSVYGATYYVAQSAGNDSNNGTSPASAWKNCPGMASYSGSGKLSPGDTVYFNSADTWVVTGAQGLYLVGGVTYIGDSWGSGVRATIRAGANLGAGVVRFKDDPTLPTILKGFNVDANHTVSTGIDINHAFAIQMNGATKRVENSIVQNVWSEAALGQYKYGIIISNHTGASATAENVEIIGTKVHDISRSAINLYPGDENAGCCIKNITVRGNETYNTGQDPNSGGFGIATKGCVTNAFIEYNYTHDTKGAGLFVNSNETNHFGFGPTNIHLRYNIVNDNNPNNFNGAIRLYDPPSGADPKDVKIYGNIVYNKAVNAGFFIDKDLRSTERIWVYNNTFFSTPVVISNTAATFITFEFKNNIVYYPAGTPITGSNRFTAFSNNFTTDPSFKNTATLPTGFTGTFGVDMAPNTDGLSLLSTSAAIGAGISLGSPYNGSINSVTRPLSGPWDIGAYQSGLGARPAPPSNLRIVP